MGPAGSPYCTLRSAKTGDTVSIAVDPRHETRELRRLNKRNSSLLGERNSVQDGSHEPIRESGNVGSANDRCTVDEFELDVVSE